MWNTITKRTVSLYMYDVVIIRIIENGLSIPKWAKLAAKLILQGLDKVGPNTYYYTLLYFYGLSN